MSPKGKFLISIAVAALAVPAMASAQQGYGQSQYPQSQPGYGQQDAGPQGYGPDQGPQAGDQPQQGAQRHAHKAQPSVYPQFRSLEKHIRRTVHQERKANTIPSQDAHRLMAQLKRIQAEEMSVYNTHGMNLPPEIQARIQGELTQLAQSVDQGRVQRGQGQPYQGRQ